MKVILSKKGLDSSFSNKGITFNKEGDNKEGEMPFVPIPSNNDKCKYDGDVINHLQKGCKLFYKQEGCKLSYKVDSNPVGLNCHLDPQLIDYFENTDAKKFKASFGQVGGPQTTLSKADVGIGDIFLFYSWYYDKELKQDQNIIFGYMQIGAIIRFDENNKITLEELDKKGNVVKLENCTSGYILNEYNFIQNNPHWNYEKYENKTNNTIYIARENFAFSSQKEGKTVYTEVENIPGFGLFNYHENLVLTEKPSGGKVPTKTHWAIKGLEDYETIGFKNVSKKLEYGKGQIVKGFGQEFIFEDNNNAVQEWAEKLIKMQWQKK